MPTVMTIEQMRMRYADYIRPPSLDDIRVGSVFKRQLNDRWFRQIKSCQALQIISVGPKRVKCRWLKFVPAGRDWVATTDRTISIPVNEFLTTIGGWHIEIDPEAVVLWNPCIDVLTQRAPDPGRADS